MAANERFTFCGVVREVRPSSIAFEPQTKNSIIDWLPRSQILDSDSDLDEIERGEELTVEIPLWLAREKGLA